jgi:hypothetical protein
MNRDLKVMDKMIISEKRSTVDEWKGVRTEKRAKKTDETEAIVSPFKLVMRDLEGSINTFKSTVPFIMNTLPIMRRLSDDRNIRQFIAKTGELLESGDVEFELYRLNIDHISAISRRLEIANAVGSGVIRIPELFLMGLISAYDQFLSQLVKCVFFVRPAILSSSERNISFKDLMEIGSVEAARDRIIEKEVESVLRESHSRQIEWLERKLDVTLRKDLKIWSEFIEICERRNLISHTNG